MRLMRLIRTAAIGLVFSLALSACVPTNVQRSPAEIAAAQGAATLAQQGHFDQAASAYLNLADQYRGQADHYRLLAVEAWRQDGQLERGFRTLAEIKRKNLVGDEPLRLDLLRAEQALDRHDASAALRLTTQPNVAIPKVLQARFLELRARAMVATGDLWGGARTRVQMDDLLSGFDQAQNRRQALDLLIRLGVGPLKQRASAMQPGDHMLPWVNEALSRLGVTVAQAQPNLQQPVGTLLPGPDATVREGYKAPAQVALLLPLDGRFAAASVPIRQGFFASYFDAGRNHAPRPSIRVYDSKGTAEGAVAAYQQAVSDGARLVVGPLTRGAVAAVFAQQQLPVPVLALNHPDDHQLPVANTSEFGLMPEAEGAQAADHMINRGIRKAYVIISNDNFALRAAKAFKAEMIARGGNVLASTTLPTGQTSYADNINSLQMPVATDPKVAGASTVANASTTGSPGGTGRDDAGIFISAPPIQARLLLPQLHLARIDLPVFATSHVYGGSDNAASNRDLDGVEFCDSPWLFNAQPGLPNRGDISALLPAARGGGARLFAFGMDAWNLVPYLDWLRAHPGSYLPGASGQLTADRFGHVRRVLTWAKFQDGLARPLNGSLQLNNVPSAVPPDSNAPAPASSSPSATPASAASAAAG